MIFSEEHFTSLSCHKTFSLPKAWVRRSNLTMIPHVQTFVSHDFFDKRQEAIAHGKSLKEFFDECTIKGKCVLGFYGYRTPRRISRIFEPVVRSSKTKQVIPLQNRRSREIRLADNLIGHLFSNPGLNTGRLFFQPRGDVFCIWDADYYMNNPQLSNSIDLRFAYKLMQKERKIELIRDRKFAA